MNTGEDVEVSGLHVSPDLDTVTYTLAGIVNEQTWWGIEGDTFECHEMLKRLGWSEMLRIGDRDRAVNQWRTLMLRKGKPLSEVTRELCQKLGVRAKVMPMSNDGVRTRIYTDAGPMSFNEFWVSRRAKDAVLGVAFEGAEGARATPGVIEAINESESIIIGPSNPITSIGPILSIREIKEALLKNRGKVIAVSPIIGDAPVSGPAGVLMRGVGYEVSPRGVAQVYKEVASILFIHEGDRAFTKSIEGLGMRVALADLLMPDLHSRIRLARAIMGLIQSKPKSRED